MPIPRRFEIRAFSIEMLGAKCRMCGLEDMLWPITILNCGHVYHNYCITTDYCRRTETLLEDRRPFLFFRVTLNQTGVTPNRKSVIFKYRDGKTSAAVLRECIHLYRKVPPEKWTRKLIIPKNGNGELLPTSAFYLQFMMTPRGPCYTATYREGKK
ncbi:hypothetical protein TNCT_652341 [Trichonephila clavata]|uniref:RING-type domain-containing protein n=1 Tax=Trichonephila clavata TaxID=2740835 RepID=A0A8X6KTX2_TRICU|nr:hypothetical protein TNCT_652341 [Trichonephila clavata]